MTEIKLDCEMLIFNEMQQHTTEDIFFLSPPLPLQHRDLLEISPFLCLQNSDQDIDHLLNLDSPEFRLSHSILVSDVQQSSAVGIFNPISQSMVQSPPSNLCSRADTDFSVVSMIKKELPRVPRLSLQQPQSKVRDLIDFLLQNSELKINVIETEGIYWIREDPQLLEVYQILAVKFNSLRKTKEEMTKYLMRKAFKFVGDISRKEKSSVLSLPEYMKEYCSPTEPFSLPFKKHSADKTMNAHFLKSVFSCPQFSQSYRLFLEKFDLLAAEDNEKKIDYLVGQVEHALKSGEIRHIQTIKRLPWTKKILRDARELAVDLVEGKIEGRKGKKGL